MSYKCEKCKRQIKPGIPQCSIKNKIELNHGSRIISVKKVCPNCGIKKLKVKNKKVKND